MKTGIFNVLLGVTLVSAAIPARSQQIGDSLLLIKDSAFLKIKDSLLNNDSLEIEKLEKKKSYFQAGLSYISNNVNLGRQDSATLNYYSPSFGYYHKSGLFALATMGYLLNSVESRVDEITLQAGYSFTAGSYDGELTATKYFFSSQSTNVNAEVKYAVSYTSGYDFGFIKPAVEGTLNFSSATDILVGFSLEHSFYAFDDGLEIDPKIMSYAGTQNFYNDYYRKRRYTIKRKGKTPLKGVASITGQVQDPNVFKILDYEASLAINYTLGKFTFSFLPVYAIPLNPSIINITKVLTTGTTLYKSQQETLSNTFYWTLGLQYNL